MPRKKETIIAVSINEPDSKHHQDLPIYNFVCLEKNLNQAFIDVDKYKIFKEKEENVIIFLNQNKTLFDKPFFINNDMVFIDEISLSTPLKNFDKYIYQLIDYSALKPCFCDFNSILF